MTDKINTRYTVPEIFLKKNKSKIVSLSCYTAQFAKIADNHADIILVGDSMGMVYTVKKIHSLLQKK